MNDATGAVMGVPSSGSERIELEKAFALFNQVSGELTQAYEALQKRVEALTAELAVANGELRRQFEAKEALSERLRLLLDALPAGVLVLDGAGRIEEVNPAAAVLLGEPLLGEPWASLAARLQATEAPDEYSLGEGPAARRLVLVKSALAAAGGQIVLAHDTTGAHDMKARLERNQRLAAMGELAAGLAHQLRTPLATALLYTAQLGDVSLPPDERSEFAEKATSRLRHLERLIRDTLLFARGEALGRERCSVADVLQEAAQTVEPLLRQRGIEFVLDDASGNAELVCDRKALVGALANLLENAMMACEAADSVQLTAGCLSSELLCIRVRDSGPGIDPAILPRLFEPFFTTRGQGTGLGLAIARGVARAHGGDIEARSALGEGAEFIIQLPLERAAAEEESK